MTIVTFHVFQISKFGPWGPLNSVVEYVGELDEEVTEACEDTFFRNKHASVLESLHFMAGNIATNLISKYDFKST